MPAPRQTPILRGRIVSGRIQWHGYDAKRLAVITKHLEGQEIELTLQKLRKKRSINQNSYYWGVVLALMGEAVGYTAEEMHEALKWKFLQKHDGALPTVRSTTDLTTVEMEEYLSKCRQLAAELYGLYVPEPNEVEMTA